MDSDTLKKIGLHILIIVVAIAGFRGFIVNRQWFSAASHRAAMKPVTATVQDKWFKMTGEYNMRGPGPTLYYLALQNTEGCACKGVARVDAQTYNGARQGGGIEALCYKGACFSPADIRWDETYHTQLWAYLLLGLCCSGYEAWVVFRALGKRG